jgi:molybdopterin molybdotransferase
VARQPRVAVVATGNELVEPDQTPSISQIRNSNSQTLMALLAATGSLPTYLGIAEDSMESLERMVTRGLEYDVMCFSGGVSMGDFDFVPDMLRQRGFTVLFDKVAVQPGKPTLFAVSEGAKCFGLPGNPVSTFVTFELFVRPFLWKMMGHAYTPARVTMPLEKSISREHAGREAWVPVVLTTEGGVAPIEYHGSAHFHALSYADGLVCVPAGIHAIEEGARVSVRLIRS